MKRFVSLFLCLLIAASVSAYGFSASAEEYTPDSLLDVMEADGPGEPDAADPVDEKTDLAATGVTLDDPIIVPRVVITTEYGNGTTLQKTDGYQNATISITDTDGSVLSDSCSFKVRGNTTAMTFIEKKAYTFKFEKKKDVLGMGKAKKWALLANAFDPTMLRNKLAFELADELGLSYTSKHQFVEVFLDGSYRGCYELTEPIQEGKTRVDIDIESNEGKKDFLIEYEAQREEADTTYFTVSGLRFIASEPEEPNEDQLAYITDTMSGIIDTLKNGSREEIEEVIDVPSFTAYYLLNEYLKTFDFDMSSVFYYYKDGKFYAGPAWDYDLSTGNISDQLLNSRAVNTRDPDGILQKNKNIYKYLGNKDWFIDGVIDLYEAHYDYLINISADGGQLDTWSAQYAEIFERNATVWKVSKWLYNYQRKPLATYQDNLDYLKNWMNDRNTWLYDYWDLFSYEYLRGDADGNGAVEVVDATAIQRALVNLNTNDDGHMALRAAVVDGELSILDATAIQRYLAAMGNPYVLDAAVHTKLREK